MLKLLTKALGFPPEAAELRADTLLTIATTRKPWLNSALQAGEQHGDQGGNRR